MAVVVVTRLRLRSFRFIPHLYWATRKIKQSLKSAPGFLHGKLLADRKHTFWTMSVWKDLDSMRAFRNSRVHAAIMPNTGKWCSEASVVHWETEKEKLPGWKEAHRRMADEGKMSPVKSPSTDHNAHKFREPYVTSSRQERIEPKKAA